MKVVVSTRGKFHCFDLARELQANHALTAIFTGYPRFKLGRERLPAASIRSFPWLHTPYMALPPWLPMRARIERELFYWDAVSFDRHVARSLPDCDVFVGLSGSALRSGREAQRRGGRYVCDRGSTHIRTQDAMLAEEHALWGLPWRGVDPRVIDTEEAEYAQADAITVPSSFVARTFVARGVSAGKLHRLSYGVDLSTFHPTGTPDDDGFDVLFVGSMSLRKGVPYLLQAFGQLQHPRKTLTFAGSVAPELIELCRQRGLWPDEARVRVLGHVAQTELKHLMSRSHAMVLPSIEEGLALVQAQALACGCVVVGTPNTGAEDLMTDGVEGFVVPVRQADALAQRLQQLADDPALRATMSARAIERVKRQGGWRHYGEQAIALYQRLMTPSVPSEAAKPPVVTSPSDHVN